MKRGGDSTNVYEHLLPGKENALTPEYLTAKCHFSSVRML